MAAEDEALEALGKSAKDEVSKVKTATDNVMKLLEHKVDIIGKWINNATILNRKLNQINDASMFEELPRHRNNYFRVQLHLITSVEDYLAQHKEDEIKGKVNKTVPC